MNSQMGAKTCQHCKWFTWNDGKTGTCWRFPPQPFPVGPNRVSSFRPAVQPEHGCGEWTVALEIARELPPLAPRRVQ
jgi:hypothetical protein